MSYNNNYRRSRRSWPSRSVSTKKTRRRCKKNGRRSRHWREIPTIWWSSHSRVIRAKARARAPLHLTIHMKCRIRGHLRRIWVALKRRMWKSAHSPLLLIHVTTLPIMRMSRSPCEWRKNSQRQRIMRWCLPWKGRQRVPWMSLGAKCIFSSSFLLLRVDCQRITRASWRYSRYRARLRRRGAESSTYHSTVSSHFGARMVGTSQLR